MTETGDSNNVIDFELKRFQRLIDDFKQGKVTINDIRRAAGLPAFNDAHPSQMKRSDSADATCDHTRSTIARVLGAGLHCPLCGVEL